MVHVNIQKLVIKLQYIYWQYISAFVWAFEADIHKTCLPFLVGRMQIVCFDWSFVVFCCIKGFLGYSLFFNALYLIFES